MPITVTQRGNTCQYFSILYLMDQANRGCFSKEDFKNFITFLTNRATNGSGFIDAYLSLSKIGTTTSILKKLKDLEANKLYYVDNSKHAVIVIKKDTGNYNVWNPQTNLIQENLALVSGYLNLGTSPNLRYPYNLTSLIKNEKEVSVWEFNSSKAVNDMTTNAERTRQIDIINRLVTYLSTPVNVTNLTINASAEGMTEDEKISYITAINIIKDSFAKYNYTNFKLALGLS